MKKSRHYRDESDPLLGFYSRTIAETSSVRSNPLYSSVAPPSTSSPPKRGGVVTEPSDDDYTSCGDSVLTMDVEAAGALLNQSSEYSRDSTNSSYSYNNETSPRRSGSYPREPPERRQHSKQQKRRRRKKSSGAGSGYRVHRVSYTAQNHVQVMFRLYGSAFPQVLPFCLANVLWTLVIHFLKENGVCDLTFHSSVGHSFMGLLVSFLVVSRSKISYDRFMEMRRALATVYHACREIAQFTTVYTFQTQTAEAKHWRQQVCFRTILLLHVTMDALLWSSSERDKWEDEYFKYKYENDKRMNPDVSEHFHRFRSLSHGRRSMIDENFRAPISFMHVLRQTIMQHPTHLGYKMAVNEYRDLLNFVTIFNDAFHSFRVLIFTPYPFPLVQMTRSFLFFWVYSLPMVLLKEYRVWSTLLIVLLVTFGFIGVEYVSIALDDPFSDDTNDVDEHGMALLVYEDIYLALYRVDGPESAIELRERVLARYKQGRGLDCYRDDLKGWDFWEGYYWERRQPPQQQQSQSQPPPPHVSAPTPPRPPTPPPPPPSMHKSGKNNKQRQHRVNKVKVVDAAQEEEKKDASAAVATSSTASSTASNMAGIQTI